VDIATLLPYAVLGGVACAVVFLYNFLAGDKNRAQERLDELRDPTLRNREGGEKKKTGMGGLLEKAAPALSKAIKPKTELEQSALKVRLSNAGFHSPNAPQLYLAIKVSLMAGGAFLGSGIGLWNFGLTQNGLVSIIVGTAMGMYLPEFAVSYLASCRKSKIFLQMPDALDLLVVCVEAGLGLDAGMRRVSDELEDAAPEVCSEFALANLQLQMGRARRDVLHDLGVRTGVDDMRALAAILIQADKFGSSIAQALRVQSDSMRTKRKQMAEEKAQQTAVKMIFPLVLFIFPGIFVVLVGPAAIMMIEGLFNQ
jgi:tight adherence protein C